MISSIYYSHYSKDSDLRGYFLESHAVHIWQASLPWHGVGVVRLSEDEYARAWRYRHEGDRHRFMAARSILRILLGHYLNVPPHAVGFHYGPYGKPHVDGIEFSLSHAKDAIAYIFTRNKPVGIDIEFVRDGIDIDGIGRRFFAAEEYTPTVMGFFETWVKKEAMIKAMGMGLFADLRQVQLVEPWKLHRFIPAVGYVGAWVIKDEN